MTKSILAIFFICWLVRGYAQETSKSYLITNSGNHYFYNQVLSLKSSGFLTEVLDDMTGSLVLTKFDACHKLIWTKEILTDFPLPYNTPNIVEASDSNLYMVFKSNVSNPKGFISKISSNGNIIWSKIILNGINSSWGSTLKSISCGNGIDSSIVVAGTVDSSGYSSPFLMKITYNGQIVWTKKYGLISSLTFVSNVVNINGAYAFFINSYVGNQPYLLYTDTSGNYKFLLHLKSPSINGISQDIHLNCIGSDNNNNVYVAARANDLGSANPKYYPILIKVNLKGSISWGYYYSDSISSYYIENRSLVINDGNKLILIGSDAKKNNVNTGESRYKVYLTETDLDGIPISRTIVHAGNYFNNNSTISSSFSSCLDNTLDGGIIGIFASPFNKFNFLIKTNKNGNIGCEEKDTTLNKYNLNLTASSLFVKTLYGYDIKDTSVNIRNSQIKETLLCSSHPYPHANLPKDSIFCTDSVYVLIADSGNAGCHFLWSTGDTTATITVKKSGRYWVKVYYGYCSAYDTINVILYKRYKSPLGKDKGICAYDSVKLQAPDTFAKWYWITPAKKKLYANSILAKDSGIYYLGFDGSACSLVDTFHLSYYPRPKAIAGPDTLLCFNQEYTMQGAGGAIYKWTPAKYLSSDSIPNPKAHLPNTQRYALIVHSKQGCVDTSYVTLQVRAPLKVKIAGDTSITCFGKPVVLMAKGQGGYTADYKYYWPYDSINGSLFQKKLFKSAWHKVVLNYGCSEPAVDSVYIQVAPKPKAAFNVLPGLKVNARAQLNFHNQSVNALKYSWSFGTAGANSNETSPNYFYSDTGTYKVRLVAYGYNDCSDTAYGSIEVIQGNSTIYIPNAFTPNRDSINEVFDISGTEIREYTLEIYNRWGERVYSGNKGWDGSYHGTISPEGVYLYTVKVTDNFYRHHFFSGTLHLLK